ncbi:MAG: ChrR family anti-sigma-E factor [Aestuariibacter sp.]
MINFHPSTTQLQQFVEGNLSPAWSLMVSAHVDMCKHCQAHIEEITDDLAGSMLVKEAQDDLVSANDAHLFDSMMNNIMQLGPDHRPDPRPQAKSIELDGRRFELPRTLGRFVHKTDGWSKLVGKLWQAPVDLGSMGKAHFIYMEKGGRVPEHTHRGNELTLVVNGEFEDGIRQFDTGDFIHLDGNDKHAPVSNHDDGCLVFSFVDEPLHFTSGLARLLNPFSHLFFR